MAETSQSTGPRITPAFATPILQHQFEGTDTLNDQLARAIRARAASDAGLSRANAGSWHSSADLLTWPDPAIAELRSHILFAAKELVAVSLGGSSEGGRALHVEAWANLARPGDYHALHDHPGAHWSGVYYVEIPEPDPNHPAAGQLELVDPRLGVDQLPIPGVPGRPNQMIAPRAGGMVCFPSWLKHCVHPVRTSGDRISISFNIRIGAAQS